MTGQKPPWASSQLTSLRAERAGTRSMVIAGG